MLKLIKLTENTLTKHSTRYRTLPTIGEDLFYKLIRVEITREGIKKRR